MTAHDKIAAQHKGIYAAISKAMSEVKRIAKDSRNAEQKYDFASVDDFLAMAGPVCAANGLVVMMDESSVEDFERQGKYGITHWLRIKFAITLFHDSGEALPAVFRTVEVIRTGAQSFGSAQSYVLKQFLRALFMIPTGDKEDADYGDKGDGPVVRQQRNEQRQPDEPARRHMPHERGPGPADIAAESLKGADSLDQLAAIWRDLPGGVKALPEVVGAKDNRKAELSRKPDTADADEIPY